MYVHFGTQSAYKLCSGFLKWQILGVAQLSAQEVAGLLAAMDLMHAIDAHINAVGLRWS